MDISKMVVAEYYSEQDLFHIQDLAYSLKDNLSDALTKEPSEFSIIGVFENDHQAHLFIEKVRNHKPALHDK